MLLAGLKGGKKRPSSFSTKSLAFDGVDEFCSRADAAAHDLSTTWTISLWVKGSGAGNYGAILFKSDNASDATRSYAILDSGDSTGKAAIQLYEGSTQKRWNTSSVVFDNTWHHLVWTFSSGTLNGYIDRVLDASPIKTVDGSITSLNNSTAGLRFGSQVSSGVAATFYSGRLNNVSLWSVALSGAEISALASGGKPVDLSTHSQYANCISWYKCGDGDTIGASGIVDTKGALHLSPTNMEAADIVTDAP